MKVYVKASTDKRAEVINRLRAIPGIKIITANNEYVVFKDKDHKEYSLAYSRYPDDCGNLFERLENESVSYSKVLPEDLTKERLETIVSQIVDIINHSSMGSSMQLVKILTILEFYNLR